MGRNVVSQISSATFKLSTKDASKLQQYQLFIVCETFQNTSNINQRLKNGNTKRQAQTVKNGINLLTAQIQGKFGSEHEYYFKIY